MPQYLDVQWHSAILLVWLQCQYDSIKLCIYVWENGNMFLCWLPTTPHKDIAQREASSSIHTVTQTKDRERERGGGRVAEVCKDILYERVAVGGQHNLPRQLIYRLSCQVLIVIVRRAYLLSTTPSFPHCPTLVHSSSQPAQRSHQASFRIS